MQFDVACFDIETTDLKPNNGIVVCAAFISPDGLQEKLVGAGGESERYTLLRVSSIVRQTRTLVTWSGKRFDVPFLNYRLAVHRLPRLVVNKHLDIQNLFPRQKNGHPASLEKTARRYGVRAKETPFSEELWARARSGDLESLRSVGKHCQEDVQTLRELYNLKMGEENEGHE